MQFMSEDGRSIVWKGMAVLLVLGIIIACAVVYTGQKTVTASVAFDNIDDYAIVTTANDIVNMSRENNTLKVTVNHDGAYPFLLRGDDGTEYNFMLTYNDGFICAESDRNLNYSLSVN